MKGFVILLFAVTATMGFEVCPEMKKYAEECAKETKVDMSVFKPDEKPDPDIFKNKDYQCFAKCISVKAGFCSEEGEPNMEKIKERFNPSEASIAQIKTCVAENKQEDSCERVFKIQDCIMKNIKMD